MDEIELLKERIKDIENYLGFPPDGGGPIKNKFDKVYLSIDKIASDYSQMEKKLLLIVDNQLKEKFGKYDINEMHSLEIMLYQTMDSLEALKKEVTELKSNRKDRGDRPLLRY